MCGRFSIIDPLESILNRYSVTEPAELDYQPNYNAAPMQYIPSVIRSSHGNRLGMLRWGLVPSWAKEDKIGSKMINARGETITEKPAFKRLINTKRCIVPCSGFYEWMNEDGHKQPMRIVMKDQTIFSMAGLYDTWADDEGNKISTCTIITTQPNQLMENIHNRMPVILRQEDEEVWLNKESTLEIVTELLRPFAAEKMRAYKVDPAVGNVKNNRQDLIREFS